MTPNEPKLQSADVGVSEEHHTLEAAHRDIAFGNNFRIEYIKHLISIATGVFVFSVTFTKDFIGKPVTAVGAKVALLLGWMALIVSIFAGILHMRYWAQYYISWGIDWTEPSAKKWRRRLDRRRRIAEKSQIYGFVLGLLFLVTFAAWNLFRR